VKTKGIWRVVAVIGILALAVTAAHAGRGSGGTSTPILRCYSINGANSPREVGLAKDDINPALNEMAAVGSAVLVCSQTSATTDAANAFDDTLGAQLFYKCYIIPGNTGPSPKPKLFIRDPFNGGVDPHTGALLGEVVQASTSQIICTKADVEVLP
jgi:hypothetical protein